MIVGLVGVIIVVLLFLVVSEAPFSMYAVPTMLVFGLPYLAMVGIAWKWPVAGGILLITASLVWPIWRLTTIYSNVSPMPLDRWLYMIAIGILPISLPMLVSGILFLLSRRGKYRE